MNDVSNFDPDLFLDSTTTEQSTKRPPLPVGAELIGTIVKTKAAPWKGREDPTQGGIRLDVTWEFDLNEYPQLKTQQGGIEKVQIIDGVMLDLNEGGNIDYGPGKNSRLRRYREALNLNNAGQSFAPRMLEQRRVRCTIKHDEYPKGSGEFFDKINAVSKA